MASLISILIPLYDEEAVCRELVNRLEKITHQLPGYSFEFVFVNDGSTDKTADIISELAKTNKKIVLISLSRNFGHQAALTAAIDHAMGDAAIIMDADLQDPPETIPLFLEKFQAGYDVVYATRRSRKESRIWRLCYWAFYRVLGKVSDCAIPCDSGDFSLLSRRVLDVLRASKERNRFLRGLRAWAGFKQLAISIDRPQRYAGKSKYSLRKLLILACDGIFSFSVVPLRLATALGLVTVFLSSLFLAYTLYAKFFLDQSPTGFTALIVSVLFIGGFQLIFLGIIGEYIGRIYQETKARPLYVIESIIRGN